MHFLKVLLAGCALLTATAHAGPVFTLYSSGTASAEAAMGSGGHNLFVVHPGAWRKAPARAAARVNPAAYASHIEAAASETQVDPALIRAVISVESGFDPAARSEKGALGLMQLMPQTAKRYGVTDRLDPAQNIRGGALYLRDLKAMFGNDLALVLAAYNAGEEAVLRYGRRIPPFRETVEYVPKVLSHYTRGR